jgi:hypothetical protein
MTPDQFNQVVEAILDGKYSWACVLILQFAGYNPLHYIPYRTYNRLMKDNQPARRSRKNGAPVPSEPNRSDALSPQTCFDRLEDLGYLEPLDDLSTSVKGGDYYDFGQFCQNGTSIISFWRRVA